MPQLNLWCHCPSSKVGNWSPHYYHYYTLRIKLPMPHTPAKHRLTGDHTNLQHVLTPVARNRALNALNCLSVDAERLLQNCTWNTGLKHLVCRDEESWVLWGQSIKCDGSFVPDIQLEMLGALWEDSEVPNLQGGSIQDVVVADEARVDRSLQHKQRLCCKRVGVEGEDAANVKVESGVRDALSVECWKLFHESRVEISTCACDGCIMTWWNTDNMGNTMHVRGLCINWRSQNSLKTVERKVQVTEEIPRFSLTSTETRIESMNQYWWG